MVEQVLDSLLQLGFLQGDRVAFIGDLYDQFPQFVQLAFDLEEALGGQGEPEEKQAEVTSSSDQVFRSKTSFNLLQWA